MRERIYVSIIFRPDSVAFQETYSVGQGRYRRRLLGRYRSLPRVPRETLGDLLRRAADAYDGRPFGPPGPRV